jgi:hypothetical protein
MQLMLPGFQKKLKRIKSIKIFGSGKAIRRTRCKMSKAIATGLINSFDCILKF